MQELLSIVKRIGIKSGVIEISFCSVDTDHIISFGFYDEDTDFEMFL